MQKFFAVLRNDRSTLDLLALAAIKLLVHLLTSQRYGYFRDEFYYIAASKRLAFGYVDFPPFIAVLTRLVRVTLGESLLALHLLPALAGAVLVFLTGLMARQLGANRFGQTLAALTALIAPQFLGVNSLLTVDAFDVLFWGLAIYVLILILKYEDPKVWLWFGLVVGLGLTNKISLLYFSLALVIGLVLTPQRKYFRSLWLYLGGAIALAFLVPYLIWNAANGWPTVQFFAAYGNKVYQASPIEFILQQILIMHPFTFPLWLMGLIYFFSKKGTAYRPLGWMYIVLLLIFMLQHAKNYFLAPIYPVLFAAGAVLFEQLVQAGRRSWLKAAFVSLLVIGGILVAPLAIPILPLRAHLAYTRITSGTDTQSEIYETGVFPQHFADRFGWEEMAVTVADVYHSLPPEDQANACIFAGNYGEAGALEFYGPRYGLPHVISGHNNYYLWGPDDCTGETVITIGAGNLEDLKQAFSDVRQVDQTHCDYCMPYENNLPIYVARGLKSPLEQLWPGVKVFQ
ncbi:MAG TPA: glycosyltransferase family 39 protein [Anaerolineales bacterium]|nr:glycosyltransferase family 39 protein [Anaerolineales bacterium]